MAQRHALPKQGLQIKNFCFRIAFRVQGFGLRVSGSGLRVQDCGFRVQGLDRGDGALLRAALLEDLVLFNPREFALGRLHALAVPARWGIPFN